MSTHDTNGSCTTKTCPKKLCRSYTIGFVLAVIFTVVAFMLVDKKMLNDMELYVAIIALAVLQLITQVVFFLRLNARTAHDKWNLISFLFTLLIMAIIVTGSLWIMYNLNYYMSH